MTPIVSIVGLSNVGKTTYLEKLVRELKARNYRVATVKHDVHGFELDRPGKDSWRHAQAGADAVVISSPEKLALIRRTDHDSTIEEIARHLGGGFDLIITEGFKRGKAPKIEVHRREVGSDLLCTEEELLALATDERLEMSVPQFPLDDASPMADFLEDWLRTRHGTEEATLYLDGEPVRIVPFVQEILSRTVFAIVSTLKGVGTPKRIELTVHRDGPAKQ